VQKFHSIDHQGAGDQYVTAPIKSVDEIVACQKISWVTILSRLAELVDIKEMKE
jgi:hypothetical protein